MPQRDSTNHDSRENLSELVEFILAALKEHEEKIDRAIHKLERVAEKLSSNVKELNLGIRAVSEQLSILDGKIKELDQTIQ